MWLEVCKYVLFKWWRHSTSTYDIWSFGQENQFSQPKITKKGSQILRKSSKNRCLGLLGNHFRASWQASWTHAPKKFDFGGVWKRPGSPRWPIWLQLGRPRPPQIVERTRKSRCQKMTCFWHRFFRCSSFILKGFFNNFLQENIRKLWKHAFSENLKNSDFT